LRRRGFDGVRQRIDGGDDLGHAQRIDELDAVLLRRPGPPRHAIDREADQQGVARGGEEEQAHGADPAHQGRGDHGPDHGAAGIDQQQAAGRLDEAAGLDEIVHVGGAEGIDRHGEAAEQRGQAQDDERLGV